MAAFNPKFYHQYRLRSVSLPTTLHPSTVKIEQIVNKLKTFETSSSSFSSSSSKADQVCNSLLGLKELYEAIEQLLALQITQQALSHHRQNPRVNALVEESVTFIDVCNNTRDTVMQMIQGVRGLQSSFRRNKIGESSIESDISAFNCSRKNLQKEIGRSLAKLKSTDNRAFSLQVLNRSEDHQILAVVKALTESSLLTVSTFSSLLLFLSVPIMKSKPSKWSLVSKLMQKGAFAGDQGQRNKLNELENVDIALGDLLFHSSYKDVVGKGKIESAQRKLEALETVLENLENILEFLFRHLIRARVSLLNILSQ